MWPFARRSEKSLFSVTATYRDRYEFPMCRITNIQDVDVQWVTGRPIQRPIPAVIQYATDKYLPLEDYVLNSAGVLVSGRLWKFISQVSSCARPYTSEVYFEGKLVGTDYVTVNFECSFPCLDARKSRFRDVGVGRLLERAVVMESRIPEGEQIFRLGESPADLLASTAFVKGISESGFSGIEFREMRVVSEDR